MAQKHICICIYTHIGYEGAYFNNLFLYVVMQPFFKSYLSLFTVHLVERLYIWSQ